MHPKNRINWWIPALIVLLVLAVTAAVLLLMPREGPPGEPTAPTEAPPSVDALRCLQFSSFSGEFVEDGTHAQVSNVAAMLVTNPTSKFLDLATVTYKVGDKIATFEITGLPPGGTAWVLEKDRLRLEEGWKFEFDDSSHSFRSDAIRQTDLLTVRNDGHTVTVTNVSDKPLKNVCIYYKVKHSDGNYFGGITYMMDFDDLEPGGTLTKQSAHYGPDAEIVRYSYQTG